MGWPLRLIASDLNVPIGHIRHGLFKSDLNVPHVLLHVGQVTYAFPMCYTWDMQVTHVLHMQFM